MKKLFKGAALGLMLMAGAGMASSCDSETINQILGALLGGGTAYTYQGTAQLEMLEGTYEPMNYKSLGKGTANMTLQLQTGLLNSGLATLTIPGVTLNGVTVGTITISNLVLSANSNNTQNYLSLGEQSSIDGTFTYNEKEYSAVTISNLDATNNSVNTEAMTLQMTVYFGDESTEAMNITYSGKIVTQ